MVVSQQFQDLLVTACAVVITTPRNHLVYSLFLLWPELPCANHAPFLGNIGKKKHPPSTHILPRLPALFSFPWEFVHSPPRFSLILNIVFLYSEEASHPNPPMYYLLPRGRICPWKPCRCSVRHRRPNSSTSTRCSSPSDSPPRAPDPFVRVGKHKLYIMLVA